MPPLAGTSASVLASYCTPASMPPLLAYTSTSASVLCVPSLVQANASQLRDPIFRSTYSLVQRRAAMQIMRSSGQSEAAAAEAAQKVRTVLRGPGRQIRGPLHPLP